MNDRDVVAEVLEDVKSKIMALPKFKDKVGHIYTYEELVDKSKNVSFPALGIIYEGLRAERGENAGKSASVVSSSIVVSLILLTDSDNKLGGLPKMKAHEYLALTRNALNNKPSPSGHKYRFIVEAPASEKGTKVMWVQRWSVAAQI